MTHQNHKTHSSFSLLTHDVPLLVGLALVLAMCLFLSIAGEGVVVTPHDQLDGEIIVYMLHAAHPFDAAYPELLNGVTSSSLVMASPASVIFYLLLEPLRAFVANWCFVIVVSYLGMYFCLRSFGVSRVVCLCASVLFACVPLYSVYGLTAMGVPLMVLAARRSFDGKTKSACALTVFYGAFSSPVLCGFAVIAVLLAYVFVLFIKGKRKEAARLALVLATLVSTYLIANMYVLAGAHAGESHRSEMKLASEAFSWSNVFSLYFDGSKGESRTFYHAESNQYYLTLFALASTMVFVAYMITRRLRGLKTDSAIKNRILWVVGLQLTALAISVFYCLFHSPGIIEIRESLPGALRTFQIDRFHWLYPTIWYLCVGIAADTLLRIFRKWLSTKMIIAVSAVVVAALTSSLDFGSSDAFATIKLSVKGTPPAAGKATWEDFFNANAFQMASAAMDPDKKSYRVISIGMHPSVAIYNGFYALDGYSNNYPLEYKHEFREIIAGELDCDEALERYFDDWGNRCYAFQHQVGFRYIIGKDAGIEISDFRINLDAFAKMGGRYIISAVPIVDCARYGLKEIGRYETDSSLYRLLVYSI